MKTFWYQHEAKCSWLQTKWSGKIFQWIHKFCSSILVKATSNNDILVTLSLHVSLLHHTKFLAFIITIIIIMYVCNYDHTFCSNKKAQDEPPSEGMLMFISLKKRTKACFFVLIVNVELKLHCLIYITVFFICRAQK